MHRFTDRAIFKTTGTFEANRKALQNNCWPLRYIIANSFCKELSLVWVCAAGSGVILTTDLAHRINCPMSTISKGRLDTVYAAKSSTKISHNIKI